MKLFVAPTNCMVLIVILLEYIESLIDPFIIIIDTIKKNDANTKTQNLILSKLSFINETRGASYDISSMNSNFLNSSDIFSNIDELTKSNFKKISMELSKGLLP
jgi:hypothetical protein